MDILSSISRYCCFCFHFGGNTTNINNNITFPNGNKDSQDTLNRLKYLESIEYKDTTPFIMPVSYGKVVKVYDGDTITVASRLDDNRTINSSKSNSKKTNDLIYRYRVRLKGIDAPEIKGKSLKEKEAAKISRDQLSAIALNKCVRLEQLENEKYGRVLCFVYLCENGQNLSGFMLENKLAVPYDGGAKTGFEE